MDFARYYHTRIRKSVDEDRAAVVAGFQQLLNQGPHSLRLVNYYKGLPICYPADLAEVKGDRIDLDVHRQQAVALARTRKVFIKSDSFDAAILAEALMVDQRRSTALLGNFVFVEIMAERREALRLQLEVPTRALILGPGPALPGTLHDLSAGGFSIRTDDRCPWEKGTEVRLKLEIPNLLHNSVIPLETAARLVEATADPGDYGCRFSCELEPQGEAAISRYLFQRQVEIIREIKEASCD